MNAQPPNPGGGGNETPNCFPPPCVPIDGGLSWLLLAGVAYGGKKVFELNKDNLDSETMHVFTIRDGKISSFTAFEDTDSMRKAMIKHP